jgi:hypothetical protein
MGTNKFIPLSIAMIAGGCDYFEKQSSDKVTLNSRIIVEQSASMSNEIEASAGVYEKIWGQDYETTFSKLPKSGQAQVTPRSGHWYPEQSGGLNSTDVLRKYDQAYNGTGASATEWEARNRTSAISWAGHCNGYAAAAIRHKEPLRAVYKNGVQFSRQDIKALLAGIYMSAGYKFLGGTRCERSLTESAPDGRLNACEDINPGMFHSILANWVGRKKQSIIFDRSGDKQVWNYPLYSFQSWAREINVEEAMTKIGGSGSTYTPNSASVTFLDVTTNIVYADAVNGYEVLDYNQEGKMGYQYVLELDANGKIIGGEWAIQSKTEHPDFMWIPLEATRGSGTKDGGNPYLDPQEVLQLWAESRGLSSPNQEPPPYDLYSFDSNWGDFNFYKVKLDGSRTGTAFSNSENKISLVSESSLISSGDDKVQVFVDEKLIASPTINVGTNVEFLAPSEPGITRMSLKWQTATYNNENEPHNIYYYSMD